MPVSLLKVPGISALAKQPVAWVLGLMGVSLSFTDFPMWIQIPAGIIGLMLLLMVALMKYEEWRESRAQRLNHSDARGIMERLQEKADRVEGVSADEIKQAFNEQLYKDE